MPTVRMDLGAAFALAASLRHDARSLQHAHEDLRNDITAAHDLLHRAQPSASAPLSGLSDLGLRLEAMARDLEWRVGILAAADHTAAQRFGPVTGILPHRSLDLILLSIEQLANAIVEGPLGAQAAAIAEAEYRSAEDPLFAAALVETLGATALVEVWADIDSTTGSSATAIQLASIQIYAMASEREQAVTVVSEVAAGLHFYEEDRLLGALRDNFTQLDTSAHGGLPDGAVSYHDLLSAADGSGPLAPAAAWIVGNFNVFQFLTVGAERNDYLASDAMLSPRGLTDARTLTLNEIGQYQQMRNAAFAIWPLLPLIDVAAQQDPAAADGHLSRRDFEVALGWPGLTDYQGDAIRQVLNDGAFDSMSNWRHALTVAGWVPVVGDAVDMTAMLYYMSRGEWAEASFYGIGMLPVPGFSGTTVKVANDMVERYARDGLRGAVKVGARDFTHRAAEWRFRAGVRDALTDPDDQIDLPAILRDQVEPTGSSW